MTQDPATLDQLRVLVAIADTGSFSAAGRRLHRVQSAVSHAVASVEEQLGVLLFDRGGRIPVPTPAGLQVLAAARQVCERADALRQLAGALSRGEEPSVGLAVDVLYPTSALARACRAFAARWPDVQLQLHSDTMSGVSERVRDGTCALGIISPGADARGLTPRHLAAVAMVTVVAPTHPLAAEDAPIAPERLGREVQVVLSERRVAEGSPDQAVLSPRTWRVHDLAAKRSLLVEGLGWGNLPEWVAADDLVAGRLVRIRPAAWPVEGLSVAMSAVTRADRVLGPAGAWLLDALLHPSRS